MNRRQLLRGLASSALVIGFNPVVLPFGHDRVAQYGEVRTEFLKRKRRYDPGNILTPGPGIF